MMLWWQQDPMLKRLIAVMKRANRMARAAAFFGGSVLASGIAGQALDPPVPHCATVDVSGDVTLSWTIPLDPNGICGQYQIWHANSPLGPFALVTNVPCGTTSFLHAGAGANAGPQFYFMASATNAVPPEVSVPSDTIATLFLQVFQSTPLGSANLSWNAPATSSTSSADFTIWLEYPIGTWTQIATVPTNTFAYQWVVDICEDSLTFRVGLADANGCISFSNRDGEVFRDVTPPSVPVVQAVSVDSTSGLSTVIWGPSPQPDTDGYIVVYNGPGGDVIIDTVFGQFNNSYTWPDSYPFGGPESFTIASFDTCFSGTPPSPNTSATGASHSTMFARTEYDRCAARTRIIWSPYVGWAPLSIQVLVQFNGGTWAVLANLPGDATTCQHDVQPGQTYCYIVKAIQGPGLPSSLSNKTCRFTEYPQLPVGNYIRTVTVTAPDAIAVIDSVDFNAQVSGYRLERSVNGAAYDEVAIFPATAGPVITYTDLGVDPSLNGYRYRMQVLDSCGSASVTSNLGANIVLKAEPGLDGINRLNWNGYIQWAGTVAGYAVYRSVADGAFEQIALLPSDPWEYDDDVNAFVAETGNFCYYVVAIEAGNPSGINATSTSNNACAFQQELIYIPNAFIIGSAIEANREIRPIIGFGDVTEYRFVIINRWNQVIWETERVEDGWDGVVGSQVMPQGIYAYYCSVRNGAGRMVVKRGTVLLLRDD
jgi:hypothetical protein